MDTQQILQKISEYYRIVADGGWVEMFVYLVVGFLLAHIVSKALVRLGRLQKIPTQPLRFIRKLVVVCIWLLAGFQALRAVGVDLVSILGAAGVAGIAIGFASQTALSNLISGFFLLSERSFAAGDYVRVNGLEGTVEGINLLSIYIRQPDNALIRVPCELLIKNPVVNLTKDDIRRCDFDLGVDYGSDTEKVERVIRRVMQEHPMLLNEPAPVVQFSGFGDSSLNLHIGAWCKTGDYHTVRYAFAGALLKAFAGEGISIPFPIRDVRVRKDA